MPLPDTFHLARIINAKEKSNTLGEGELEKLFYQPPTTEGYVSAFNVDWFVEAFKKSGARNLKIEPVPYWRRYNDGRIGIEYLYPMQLLTYEGLVDLSVCLKLIYN